MAAKKPKKQTPAQRLLGVHLAEIGIYVQAEYQFAPPHKFRFDLFDPESNTGFEVSGGRWARGHRSSRDIESAYEKMNLAQVMGFKCLEFTNEQVLRGEAKAWVQDHVVERA